MISAHIKRDVGEWREKARQLLRENIPPEEVIWNDSDQQTLLPGTVRVPKAFLDITKYAGCHRDADRWQLMYRVLWRLTHGEPRLLDVVIDDDVRRLLATE
jgi:uracil-DNA glycosylase